MCLFIRVLFLGRHAGALGVVKLTLADAQRLGGDLQQLVLCEELDALLKRKVAGRDETKRVIRAGDVTWTADGCGHGLSNEDGKEDVVFMALIINS